MLEHDEVDRVPPEGGGVEYAVVVGEKFGGDQIDVGRPRDRQDRVVEAAQIEAALAVNFEIDRNSFDIERRAYPVAVDARLADDADGAVE